MEYRYLVASESQLRNYQEIAKTIIPSMEQFIQYLQVNYGLSELPMSVIFSDGTTATQLISKIPVPAYTNEYRTIFCPELAVWQEIYLHQLDGNEDPEIRRYYEDYLTQNHVLQILGHEFVHHCDIFQGTFDSYYDSDVWFEEGMCEYISRKYFLTDAQFRKEAHMNRKLVELFEDSHGYFSLGDFVSGTYQEDFASIFCGYWNSFLAVQSLVDSKGGDVKALLKKYYAWTGTQPLSQYFQLE